MSPEQPSLFDIPPAASGAHPAIDPATPLSIAFEAWLDHLQKMDVSFHTFQAFKCDVNILFEHLDPAIPLNRLTTAALNQFLNWMRVERGKPCSDKTYGRRV